MVFTEKICGDAITSEGIVMLSVASACCASGASNPPHAFVNAEFLLKKCLRSTMQTERPEFLNKYDNILPEGPLPTIIISNIFIYIIINTLIFFGKAYLLKKHLIFIVFCSNIILQCFCTSLFVWS